MKNLTFKKVFWTWLFFALVLLILNGMFFKSSLLASLTYATLGIFLLIRPVCPENVKESWGEEKAGKIMRTLAVLEIVFSFLYKTNFPA